MPAELRIFAYSTFFVVYRCFPRFLQHPIATHHRFRYDGHGLAALFDVNPRSTRPMNVLSGCCSTRSSRSISLTITMARRRLHRPCAEGSNTAMSFLESSIRQMDIGRPSQRAKRYNYLVTRLNE